MCRNGYHSKSIEALESMGINNKGGNVMEITCFSAENNSRAGCRGGTTGNGIRALLV